MIAKIERDQNFFIIKIFIFLTLFIIPTFGVWDTEIEDYKKIIFFHEILYRVEEPLQYEVWKQRGDQLHSNKNFYKEYNEPMEFFKQQYEYGELLRPGEFFGSIVKIHAEQARGLYHFLYQPIDWNIFVQNACWARQHINAHMFVYAFTLAAIQRQLDHAMMLPKIYEILPHYFFDKNFVKSVKKFNFTTPKDEEKEEARSVFSLSGNFHIWQWWKFKEPNDLTWRFYNLSLKSSINVQNDKVEEESIELKMWWRPVDYTRDLNVMNKQAKLTYLTEDVDWNAYWYNLNLFYASFLPSKQLFWRNETRRGEFWLYSLQQMMTRYKLERFSLSFDKMPTFEWHNVIEDGYEPFLADFDGHDFESRKNNFELKTTIDNYEILMESRYALEHIEETINDGCFFYKNGSKIDLNESTNSLEIIGNLFQCNIDALDGYFDTHWYQLSQLYLSGSTDNKNYRVQPNVLLNFETMLRDPLFYIFHKRIVDDIQKFRDSLKPYKMTEIYDSNIEIVAANVSELVSHFELFDTDVSNLKSFYRKKSNENILFARQMRLAHKPYHFNLTINAKKSMTALLRIFLAPRHDAHGNQIALNENRQNFLELHKIKVHLKQGENYKIFNYEKYFEQQNKDRIAEFQTKIYFNALDPIKRINLYNSYESNRYCGLNERLLLPRGYSTGLSMQLFFMLNSHENNREETENIWWKFCLPLKGKRAFGYPFDRPILNEYSFKQKNMFWQNIKIYHKRNIFDYK